MSETCWFLFPPRGPLCVKKHQQIGWNPTSHWKFVVSMSYDKARPDSQCDCRDCCDVSWWCVSPSHRWKVVGSQQCDFQTVISLFHNLRRWVSSTFDPLSFVVRSVAALQRLKLTAEVSEIVRVWFIHSERPMAGVMKLLPFILHGLLVWPGLILLVDEILPHLTCMKPCK